MFNPSPTEVTTAATDAMMGLLCLWLGLRLRAVDTTRVWQRGVWLQVFALLFGASVLGALAHGFDLPADVRSMLWLPLYLCLGLAISLFVVGATAAWKGDDAGARLYPWALAAGVAFFAASQLLGGAFIIFVVYEAVAMLLAFVIYAVLASHARAGAALAAAGVAMTLVAAGIQASTLRVNILVPLDHNGLFHLAQMVATIVVARGVRVSLLDA